MPDLIRYREGDVTVTVDDGLRRWVESLLEETGGVVYERIERDVRAIFDEAVARWPVKTGRSRDGLRTAVLLDRGAARVEGQILALVPYSVYIKSVKGGLQGKNAWQSLVRGPMTLLKRRLLAELGDVIVGGGRRRAR